MTFNKKNNMTNKSLDKPFLDTGIEVGQLLLMDQLPPEIQELITVNGISFPLFKSQHIAMWPTRPIGHTGMH